MIYTIDLDDKHKKYHSIRYPAGETQTRIYASEFDAISDADSWNVVARIRNGEIVELAQLVDALHHVDNARVDLILPYLPYSRADRRFVRGDTHGLLVFAKLLNSIPYARVFTLDAHSTVASAFVRDLTNVDPDPFIKLAVENMQETADEPVTILLPDKGSVDRYLFINNALYCGKERDALTGKILEFQVPPKEAFQTKKVLIVDDICDGGGTFLGIAGQLASYNLELSLYVTHGIFSQGFDKLAYAFRYIYTTDSFNTSPSIPFPNVQVFPSLGVIRSAMYPKSELWRHASQI